MKTDIGKKLKTVLDETRLLILGAQILMGFHLNAAFQNGFTQLSPASRELHAFAFTTMVCAVGLLIAPSLQHRIVERGHASARILRVATRFADWALLPIAVGLAIDLYVVVGFRFGTSSGVCVAVALGALALFLWYGAEWLLRIAAGRKHEDQVMTTDGDTPLDERVEHMLTETRVLIPGAQALFGFQLAILLTEPFATLPQPSKLTHLFAVCCIAIAVVLLMAPAAFHRITYGGRNSEDFLRLGSSFVIAGAAALAFGIPADLYVAISSALGPELGAFVAFAAGAGLLALWFVAPIARRSMHAAR
jgi:Family of unknown function (DUF6328)